MGPQSFMARPKKKATSEQDDGKRLQGYLPAGSNWANRFEALRKYRDQSESAVVAGIVSAEIVAFEGGNAKQTPVNEIKALLLDLMNEQKLTADAVLEIREIVEKLTR